MAMSETPAERNKSNVVEFYDLMFNGNRPAEAIERFVGAEYVQHNPHVGDGKVIEHWDALQVIPDGSANSNGMF